jgi:hypothetical protein
VHAALADREVEDYSETISMFKENPKVAPFFGSAFGYAVFPTNGKGGLSIGASHGKGQVYRGGAVTGFTPFSDVSIGFQAGGQASSQLTINSLVATSSLTRRLLQLLSLPAHRPAPGQPAPRPVPELTGPENKLPPITARACWSLLSAKAG